MYMLCKHASLGGLGGSPGEEEKDERENQSERE